MWPGTGHAQVQWGSPGLPFPVGDGLVWARQHRQLRLEAKSTKRLCSAVDPDIFTDQAHSTVTNVATKAAKLGFGSYITEDLAKSAYESQYLLGNHIDLTIGRKIYHDGTHLFYGDGSFLSILESDHVLSRIDLQTPILQIEGPLIRTRKGLLYMPQKINPENGSVLSKQVYHTIAPGTETMDTSWMTEHGSAALLERGGMLSTYDLETQQLGWRYETHPIGNSRWGRVNWSKENTLMWTSRRESMLFDIRAGPKQIPIQLMETGSQVSALVDTWTSGNDAFFLSSSKLIWSDLRFQKQVLSWEHSAFMHDDSLSLTGCGMSEGYLFCIGSQSYPYSTLFTFGRDNGIPVSFEDPYMIERWPNAVIQSQLLVAGDTGFNLYMAEKQGGLIKQSLDQVDDESTGCVNHTEPDPDQRPPTQWGRQQKDFDLLNDKAPSQIKRMDNMYKWIFDLKRPDRAALETQPAKTPKRRKNTETSTTVHKPRGSILPWLLDGRGDITSMRDHLHKMWVESLPQNDQGSGPAGMREEAIEEILNDMEKSGYHGVETVSLADPDALSEPVKELYDAWDKPISQVLSKDESFNELGSSQKVRHDYKSGIALTANVPSQLSSTQPGVFSDISFSQPLAPVVATSSSKTRPPSQRSSKLKSTAKIGKTKSMDGNVLVQASQSDRASEDLFQGMFLSQPVSSGIPSSSQPPVSLSQPVSTHKKSKKQKKRRVEGFG